MEYDLHNDFNLAALEFDFESKGLCLRFEPCDMALERSAVDLRFIKIDMIFLSPRLLSLEELVVIELGYKNPDDFDYDWLVSEEKSTPCDHFVVALSEGEYIRVSCESIIASLT